MSQNLDGGPPIEPTELDPHGIGTVTDFPELDAADVEAPDLNDDLELLASLNADAQRLDREAKAARAKLNAHRAHCYERMESEGVGSTRIDDVGLFVRNEPTWYATVQDREALHAWLQENRPTAIKHTEEEAILNRIVRACIDDGREFPPGLGAYPRKVVAVRK